MKKKLFFLLLTLAIVSSLVAGTMATYTKTLEPLKGSATAKQFYIGSTETAFPKIKLAPTESTVWNFSVINYRNDVPTEVDMDLDIIVNLGAAENRAEIDGLTLGLYEGETQLGTTIIRNGTIEVTLPKAFDANVKAQRDFSLRLLWLNGAVSDAVDTLNADHFNTSKISVTVTGRQSIEQHNPDNDPTVKWDGTLSSVAPVGTEYVIDNPSQLAWIADQVKTGANDFSGKTIKMTTNFDLDNRAWTPIGKQAKPFMGSFNGTDHTISNLKVSSSALDTYAGLFGYNKGTVSHIKVKDAQITTSVTNSSLHYAGTVVGLSEGTVKNASVDMTVINSKSARTGALIGGVVAGNTESCAVSNTTINKTGGSYQTYGYGTGLAIGFISGNSLTKNCTVTKCTLNSMYNFSGGFVGNSSGGRIQSCSVFDATVNGNGGDVGGFVGISIGGSAIQDCKAVRTTVSGVDFTGGFIGLNGITGTPIGAVSDLSDCLADTVTVVSSGKCTGGFAGASDDTTTITNSTVKDAKVSKTASSSKNRTGGFIGFNAGKSTITNCKVQTVTITTYSAAQGDAGGFVGQNASYYSSGGAWLATIKDCTVTGVTLITNASAGNGGFVGQNMGGKISDCSAEISSITATGSLCGSFGGRNYMTSSGNYIGEIIDCFVSGELGSFQFVSQTDSDGSVTTQK